MGGAGMKILKILKKRYEKVRGVIWKFRLLILFLIWLISLGVLYYLIFNGKSFVPLDNDNLPTIKDILLVSTSLVSVLAGLGSLFSPKNYIDNQEAYKKYEEHIKKEEVVVEQIKKLVERKRMENELEFPIAIDILVEKLREFGVKAENNEMKNIIISRAKEMRLCNYKIDDAPKGEVFYSFK